MERTAEWINAYLMLRAEVFGAEMTLEIAAHFVENPIAQQQIRAVIAKLAAARAATQEDLYPTPAEQAA